MFNKIPKYSQEYLDSELAHLKKIIDGLNQIIDSYEETEDGRFRTKLIEENKRLEAQNDWLRRCVYNACGGGKK